MENTGMKDWIRIQLDATFSVEALVVVQSIWQNLGNNAAKIYVGDEDSTTPSDNPLCLALNGSGMYECTSKLSG